MAHFAQIDENNVVTQVIVVDNKDTYDYHAQQEDEIIGVAFCKKLLGGNWIQASYNGNIRARYPGIGYTYDRERDVFLRPQPAPSWTLNNDTTEWNPPITMPSLTEEENASGSYYVWNEDAYQADNTTGWELVTPE